MLNPALAFISLKTLHLIERLLVLVPVAAASEDAHGRRNQVVGYEPLAERLVARVFREQEMPDADVDCTKRDLSLRIPVFL